MILKIKHSYSGARATVTTTAGNKFMFMPMVLLDIKLMQMVLMMVHQKKILFIMQFNQKIPLIIEFQILKKVYIGFNIGNTTPTGVSFKEADGTTVITDNDNFDIAEDDNKDLIVGEIYATSTQEPDTHDFVRFNLGEVPNDDSDKDVDHGTRFRIDQKDDKFYLVLNDDSDIRWANLPSNKKYFSDKNCCNRFKRKSINYYRKSIC